MSDMGHHGGHGGHMHAGHGGDGGGFAQSFTHGGHQHHGFFSHLLGLDHDHGHHLHGGHQHGGQGVHTDPTPQGSPSWSSPLQAVKLSDVLQGINVTPNVLFLFLFFAFFGWLFVIYWVRHHDPMAHTQIGQSRRWGYASTATVDRQIVAGMRHAVPIRTSPYTGDVYVPTGTLAPVAGMASSAMAAVPGSAPVSGVAQREPAATAAGGSAPPAPFGAPASSPELVGPSMGPVPQVPAPSEPAVAAGPVMAPVPAFSGTPGGFPLAPPASAPLPAAAAAGQIGGQAMGAYCVPVQTPDGPRVKTVTSR